MQQSQKLPKIIQPKESRQEPLLNRLFWPSFLNFGFRIYMHKWLWTGAPAHHGFNLNNHFQKQKKMPSTQNNMTTAWMEWALFHNVIQDRLNETIHAKIQRLERPSMSSIYQPSQSLYSRLSNRYGHDPNQHYNHHCSRETNSRPSSSATNFTFSKKSSDVSERVLSMTLKMPAIKITCLKMRWKRRAWIMWRRRITPI